MLTLKIAILIVVTAALWCGLLWTALRVMAVLFPRMRLRGMAWALGNKDKATLSTLAHDVRLAETHRKEWVQLRASE